VGTGKGTFHIGAVSLMPADNLNGYRADLIAEMKKIGPTMFRWPGGNMVSSWDWRDSIGDPTNGPAPEPRLGEVQQNDLGIDELHGPQQAAQPGAVHLRECRLRRRAFGRRGR